MGKLSKADVKHVAKLAKLDLTPKEVDKFQNQLAKVISYVGQLNEVDIKKAEPTSQTTGLENVTREDKVKKEDVLKKEEVLSGTEEVYNGYFKVPRILQEDKS